MSRSRRKNPIMGITTCRSEKDDKKTWHQRWRARSRDSLASLLIDDLDAYLPILENQVSNIWQMGKDGKQYWPLKSQATIAEQNAQDKGHSPQERASLKLRQLHKSMSK